MRVNKARSLTIIIFLLILGLAIFNFNKNYDGNKDLAVNPDSELEIIFFDVGQADSSLIRFPDGQVILIDGGSRKTSDELLKKLDKLHIDRIDYLVATHPHEDHIGGLPEIIRNKDVGRVYLSNVTNNTKIFEDLLLSIKEKELEVIEAKAGVSINPYLEILGPKRKHKDINNNSIIVKLDYGKISALFTGDAEIEAENDILDFKSKLKSYILKVGHHGSNTSTSEEFLNWVDPEISIISVGAGNKYGHPNDEVIERLESLNSKILRTDQLGDISIITDGKEVIIN